MDGDDDRDLDDLGRRTASSSSSERIVAGDRRVSFRVVAAVVAAFLAVGVVLTWDGGGARDAADGGEGGDEPTAGEMEVTDATDVSAAYAEAVRGLGRAGSFAYRGTVRSDAASDLRPGPWIAEEVTVEGAVHLPLSITTEVAIAPDGTAVETVTSGPSAWARQATDGAGLAAAPWTVVREDVVRFARGPTEPRPSRLGAALVVDAVQSAGDRRDAPRDEAGRRVLRATVQEPGNGRGVAAHDVSEIVGGAEVAIAIDDAGDIVRVELVNPPGLPALEVRLDIERLGDPDLVGPADLAEPIGAALPPDVLAQAGLGSLEVPGLPEGWALTEGSVHRPDASLGPVPAGCDGPVVLLTYNDLTGVATGMLGLTVERDGCTVTDTTTHIGTAPYPEPVTAGRFAGSSYPYDGGVYRGWLSDGTTGISFATDLPPESASAAIASLVPAEPLPVD